LKDGLLGDSVLRSFPLWLLPTYSGPQKHAIHFVYCMEDIPSIRDDYI